MIWLCKWNTYACVERASHRYIKVLHYLRGWSTRPDSEVCRVAVTTPPDFLVREQPGRGKRRQKRGGIGRGEVDGEQQHSTAMALCTRQSYCVYHSRKLRIKKTSTALRGPGLAANRSPAQKNVSSWGLMVLINSIYKPMEDHLIMINNKGCSYG